MEYDKPLIAALIGALSTVPAEILTWLLVRIGIGEYSIYQLNSLLITFNRPSLILGLIVNFLAGGLIAVIVYYATQKLGRDYLVLKSLAFGGLFWLIFELICTATIEGQFIELRPISDYYLHLLGTATYGLTLGLLLNKIFFKRSLQT